jgi:cytochrome c oxidase accessory protein FixG
MAKGKSLPILQGSTALRSDGGRTFVVPADVNGRFWWRRRVIFTVLVAIYVALPWLQVGGHPAVFLDLAHRTFYLFGGTFNAQDFWMSFFLLSGIGFTLIVATALWGRVWCGYACPQTVFLDGLYRQIERLIEGPRNVRLKRDQAGFSLERALRKLLKHGAFVALSFLVAHVFLSYFTSLHGLFAMMKTGPLAHPEAFAWALGTTALMYFNFAWFREQLCIVICPYGRLQSVLTDPDTLVIGYDAQRGEPRGKLKEQGKGDCVDCGRCVVVCPTGIDIRNGLQLECIGCAACIDACDEVMDKVGRPRGLIRYDSQQGLTGKAKRFMRPRVYLYAFLGALGLTVAAASLRTHSPFEANLLRLSGAPFVLENEATRVRNALELHLVNKRGEAVSFRLRANEAPGMDYVLAQRELTLEAMGSVRIPVFVSAPNDRKIRQIELSVSDGKDQHIVRGPFVAPH